jgi:hypothetical protein
MDWIYIPKKNINQVWVLAYPYIKEALSYSNNHHHPEHFKDLLNEGKLQLWMIWNNKAEHSKDKLYGIIVSEIIQKSIKKVCHIAIATGKNRQKWQHLIEKLENFAKDQGCDCMELIARPGWQKILDKYNYKKTHVVLEKELKEKD